MAHSPPAPPSSSLEDVDLPAKDEDDTGIFVGHRLVTGFGQVDDRQATMPKTSRPENVMPSPSGPRWATQSVIRLQSGYRDRRTGRVQDARNTAHGSASSGADGESTFLGVEMDD